MLRLHEGWFIAAAGVRKNEMNCACSCIMENTTNRNLLSSAASNVSMLSPGTAPVFSFFAATHGHKFARGDDWSSSMRIAFQVCGICRYKGDCKD